MATFKHISSKNADYGAAEQYLTFEHDEFTMKPTLDENGRLIPRDDYRISSLNCGGEDFAIACMRSNLKYGKNQKREDVKSHHYIISFDPRDAQDNGLTVDRAQQLGEQFCKEHFSGHQALVCTHPDGHNHSGNIHVHIVINSLRIAEVPLLPYMERPADTREGCKHRCTDAAMEYFKAEVMEMCHRENLYQIDLLHGSKNRVTEREYAGSLFADYAISQKPDFSLFHFPAEQICKNSIDYLLAHPDNTIEAVIEEQLLRSGINLPDKELRVFISSCVYIERVVSSYYREKIVGSVAMAGIPLTIYGDGWAGCDWIDLPNVHYGGRISPEEVLTKMEDSKIILNTMPWFKAGSHERIFNAMLRSAVVVSETSSYLEETLPAETWVSFKLSPKDLSVLPQRISNLLSNNHAMQTTASAGYQHTLTNHTWQARTQELHRDLLSLL